MSAFRLLLLSLCSVCLFPTLSRGDCVIIMAYKNGQKPPFIGTAPNNSGAYKTLFEQAAKDIGCSLTIQRIPKKRLHGLLAHGELDFYPGTSFSTRRANYLYFIANGFTTRQVGLTRAGMTDITNYAQIKENNMTWLMEIGSSKVDIADHYGIKKQTATTISIDKARKLLLYKRSDFYIADQEPALHYLYTSKIKSWQDIGLQAHENCCGGQQAMYLGFSRKSPHFSEKANPTYEKDQPLSIKNFPTIIDESCVAYKFGKALQVLQGTGQTEQIYNEYFFKSSQK